MATATTQLLKPRTLSPFGGALDTSPTSGIGVSGFADPNAPKVRAAPTGPASDTNPSGQTPYGTVSLAPTTAPLVGTTGGGTVGFFSAPADAGSGTSSGSGGTSSGTGQGTQSGGGTQQLGGAPIDTTGGPVGTPAQDTLTNRLLDLVAAQYASGGAAGQNPDFGGLLTAPVSNATGADATGDTGAAATSAAPSASSHILPIVLILALVGGIYWWRKRHKKKAA